MESSQKKGTFVGYSETSKEFRIYVPAERHVEVNQDVNFHDEETFKWSNELECDPEIEEDETPISEDHDDDSSPSDVQKENPAEHAKLTIIDEPVELVDEPPAKRRSPWCRHVLKDVEMHGALISTSRECKKPNRYLGYVALMRSISDSEPSSYEEATE